MASIDRLSDLPDEIISHILSFLPIKTSVSTSTLAARWRFLWAYAPNIQIVNFAHRDVLRIFLPQCEAHGLNTLRILGDIYFDWELERFLGSAVACKMKTLEITQTYDYSFLPPCVLASQTLVDLKLSRFFIKMKNVTVCLPALKRLHVTTVRLHGSIENLISGCPVLEEFTGFGCYEDVESHCISSSTMKKLVLDSHFRYKLKIDTPVLNYLLLQYDIPHHFSVGSMDSLIEAHIVVDRVERIVKDDLYSHSLLEFLGRFSNVKKMTLCAWPCSLGKVPDFTPVDLNIKFHNLTKLTVKGDWRFISYFVEKANMFEVLNVIQCLEPNCEMEPIQLPMATSIMKLHNLIKLELQVDWWLLTYILEKADKLKVLIIRNVYFKQKRKRWLAAPLQVPNCLSSHLKIVEIHELNGTEHELDMVRYLLKNAKVLERMELHCLAESIGRISSFDRGSDKCEIVFNEYLESDSDDD
ncbi:F-box protein [Striga hermonthica]|uniref:F-box protein n=1 Tax=Striga hermonthica TaxID=68872 RepID=A0A9N7MU96_STRHE|nr:F-box protein [Striga hermonthica]